MNITGWAATIIGGLVAVAAAVTMVASAVLSNPEFVSGLQIAIELVK